MENNSIRMVGSLSRVEAAFFLEDIAQEVRSGKLDVQSIFEGLEITSQNLNGFQVHIKGQIQGYHFNTITHQVRNMFYEKHRISGSWINVLIEEAYYRCENYFEDDYERLVENAEEQFFNADLVYYVTYALWQIDDVFNNDWISESSNDAIVEYLPSEAFENED